MSQASARLITPKTRDLGSFAVRRVLPAAEQRSVGPFVFFDHVGPVVFGAGQGIDVGPHPHIGLATVTYLFEGEFVHRYSLGYMQPIKPGDVNWMTAGRGIVHSERIEPEQRQAGSRLHAIQSWVALARDQELRDPAFHHHPAASLPPFTKDGVDIRGIAGHTFGHLAPVEVHVDTLYVDARMPAGSLLVLPDEHRERGLYVAEGAVTTGGGVIPLQTMAVFATGDDITITAKTASRLILLGGAPLDGPRIVWWNFVASQCNLIEAAKERWRADEFGTITGESGRLTMLD